MERPVTIQDPEYFTHWWRPLIWDDERGYAIFYDDCQYKQYRFHSTRYLRIDDDSKVTLITP